MNNRNRSNILMFIYYFDNYIAGTKQGFLYMNPHYGPSFNLTKEALFSANSVRLKFSPREDASFPETLVIDPAKHFMSDTVCYQSDETGEMRVLEFTDIRSHFGPDDESTFKAFERFYMACKEPSDMKGHMNALFHLAFGSTHVTEFGTRTGVSTAAFIAARPEIISCYDTVRTSQVDEIKSSSGPTHFRFFEQSTLECAIDPTDILLLDTLHVYDQVKTELELHASKVRRYIIFHDTVLCGLRWMHNWDGNKPILWTEDGKPCTVKGIRPAIYEFLKTHHEWYIVDERLFCNGLMIIGRKNQTKKD